jgi:hypothetical protein
MYVHVDPYGAVIAYTEHLQPAFKPASAQHYSMDRQPIGSSHYMGKLIEHRDATGAVVGHSKPRGWRGVEHSGESLLAHLTGGFMLLRHRQYVNTG